MKRLMLITFLSAVFCLFLTLTFADIPRTINYQGKLTNKQGYVLNGTYDLIFRLYDASTGGSLLWQEAHSGVSVSKGLVSVLLGMITPLNLAFDKQYYLSVQVGADSPMAPRQPLASAPYAFTATHASKAGSLDKSEIPVGTIMLWSTDTPPDGWLLCNGAEISRSTYSELFNAIGTIYGAGDSSATYNLPDLRGRFPLGQDDMGGANANHVGATEADNLGQFSGEENHTLIIGEIPAHTHARADGYPMKVSTSSSSGYTVNTIVNPSTTGSTGDGGAHNNMPPYLTLNYIIKY